MLRGRHTKAVVEHDYEDGRLARSVTTRESPWTDRDVDLAIAYEQVLADLCPGCRNPLSETTARKNKEPVHSYKANFVRCQACDEKAREQDEHSKKGAVPRPEATFWGVTKDCDC